MASDEKLLLSLLILLKNKYIIYFFHFNSKETNNGKNFETVKHGSRTLESLADRRPRLDLENKFDALGRS